MNSFMFVFLHKGSVTYNVSKQNGGKMPLLRHGWRKLNLGKSIVI